MSRPPTPSWIQVLLVAVPSSILSCLVTIWMVNPAPPPPTVAVPDTGEIVRRLEEMQQRIDEWFTDRAAEPAPAPTRRRVTDPSPEIERMGSLVDRLAALLVRTRAAGGAAPIPRELPVNHMELGALHALWKQDREAAKRSTMLLTASEVAARFGFPDDVGGTDGGGVFWNYHHFGPDGARDGGTLFVFMDGRVAWHEFSVPNLRLR